MRAEHHTGGIGNWAARRACVSGDRIALIARGRAEVADLYE